MPSSAKQGGGESLSLQTLVIAAAASAAAAVIVSHVWKDGTVIAAAMTPVIISIVKELLARPMESELVRKPVSKIASGSRAAIGSAGVLSGRAPAPGRSAGRPSDPGRARAATRGTGDPLLDTSAPRTERSGPRLDPGPGNGTSANGELTPMRTYGRSRRRPLHLKVALVTGLIAFLIAAAALTLPELLFGGAVSSHHSTTLFGGGSGKAASDKKKSNDRGSTTQPGKTDSGQTAPATPPPTSGGKAPTTTTPAPTTPAPQQTTPQQTTPVPTTPSPPVP
jgi:uncharacterized membrane protein YvlD (DUF360 family)